MRKHCTPTMKGGVIEKGSPAWRLASARSRPTNRTSANVKRMTPQRSLNEWYSSFSLMASFLCRDPPGQLFASRCVLQDVVIHVWNQIPLNQIPLKNQSIKEHIQIHQSRTQPAKTCALEGPD